MEEGTNKLPPGLPSPAPKRVAFAEKHSFHRIPHTAAAAPVSSGTSAEFSTHHEEGMADSHSNSSRRRRSNDDVGTNLWTRAEPPDLENNDDDDHYNSSSAAANTNNKSSNKTVPCHTMQHSSSHKRKFVEGSPGRMKQPTENGGGGGGSGGSGGGGAWSARWGSFHNTLKESIQNSWHLGFLFPEDDDDALEYLLHEEKRGCQNHDDHDHQNHDHDDHHDHHDYHHDYHQGGYEDLTAAAKNQSQQRWQKQQQLDSVGETDSLLQHNSGANLNFSSQDYGTWHPNPPYPSFPNGEFKAGSLQQQQQNHSISNSNNHHKGHKASGLLSSAIHPETAKIMHVKSEPNFVIARNTGAQEDEDETTLLKIYDDDVDIHKTLTPAASLQPSKSMPAELHPHHLAIRKSFHRCNTAPAMSAPAAAAVANQDSNSSAAAAAAAGVKKPPPMLEKSGELVMQAGIGLMVYLAVGVMIYTWKRTEFSGTQTVSYVDALYFCIVTMCTIGYGDITPITTSSKLFACLFVLIGFGFIDVLLSSMVSYVLDKQEHLLLSAVEGSHYQVAKNYFMNPHHHNRVRIRLKVALAAGVPVLCIVVGTLVMMQMEELSWVDALYCTTMSITTVGYGDHTFKSFKGRLFAAVWLLFSTLAVARCFLYLAEARVDKRHRAIAKWVLRRQFSVGDLIKADLDHDGSISKAEYVVYKLKEMGHVEEEHIHDICLQFDQLDCNNTGKITLARLQDGN